MTPRKPPALKPDANVGVVSPSSPGDDARLDAGVSRLESRGFRVLLAPHARDRRGHLAGFDADRAADFSRFYADSAIDILWCARGGSSSLRLWPLLDWPALAALPPKMVVGYSDITSLHVPLSQKIGVVSLHGPMVSELGDLERVSDEILDWGLGILTGAAGEVPRRASEKLVGGTAEGELCGGCLSLLRATLGTPYQLDASGKILLLEDIGERPWRVERDLIQMREAGILGSAAGIVFGQITDADETSTLPLRQIYEDILTPLGVPVMLGFPFGHVKENFAVPLGVKAKMDADTGTLTLLEPAVK